MRTLHLLILLVLGLMFAACGPDLANNADDDDADDDDDDAADDDDDGTPDDDVIIVAVYPEPDDSEIPVNDELWVQFSEAPSDVSLTLTGPGGQVPMEIEVEDDGVLHVASLGEDLLGEERYQFTIGWAPPSASLVTVEFTTAAIATPDEMEATVGVTYAANLIDGEFTEPEGVGGIIQDQLDDVPLMLSVRDESEFGLDDQPGFHMIGAVGAYTDIGTVVQGPCVPSIGMTAGPDQVFGTDDDDPGSFISPQFTVRPSEVTASAQGIAMTLTDVIIIGNFPPSLAEIQSLSLSGSADTRPLDPLLGEGEGAICELLEDTVGLSCYECGEPDPGEFCLDIVVEELTATIEAEPVVERTCADVIDLWETTSTCATEAWAYDEDGDGTYEGCPIYVP